jgi:hypothetical protein
MNNEILQKISELIKNAPDTWAETIAIKMGKSVNSVYAYARGDRGLKKGYHKEVLKFLKEIIASEKLENEKLIQ